LHFDHYFLNDDAVIHPEEDSRLAADRAIEMRSAMTRVRETTQKIDKGAKHIDSA
jgi:hypothetical protein